MSPRGLEMSSRPIVRPSSDVGPGQQRALGDRLLAGRVEDDAAHGACHLAHAPTSLVTGWLPTAPFAHPAMMAENSPAPPPACTMSRPPGRNFGSVAPGQPGRARPRRCRRRPARSRRRAAAAGRAAPPRGAGGSSPPRRTPGRARATRRGWRRSRAAASGGAPCAGRRRATTASDSGVARHLVDDAARALRRRTA